MTGGGVVLDPFCGCATTLVAAETLERQWIGIDIWQGSHNLVVNRLHDTVGVFGKVTFTDQPPERTDDESTASPFLRVKESVKEPEGQRMSRAQMYEFLLAQNGSKCQGCDREFDDQRYLELDHNTPRSDGGWNHISNRILLCGPCNRLKSNTYTLSGLRRQNKKLGYMRQ
ncbi:MAG: HNH endonuclease [Gammaproteobacteria bacterium]|nr:HNH endonuclease [Gammaproteobacteria bacterium]